jgi:hypothetical protein
MSDVACMQPVEEGDTRKVRLSHNILNKYTLLACTKYRCGKMMFFRLQSSIATDWLCISLMLEESVSAKGS